MSNEVVFRALLEEIINSVEISPDFVQRARTALDKPVPKSAELTRRQRLDTVINALEPIDFIGVHSIMKFVHGTLSVGDRTKRLKIPLSFDQKEILPEANLAHLQSIESCNTYLAIVSINMEGAAKTV